MGSPPARSLLHSVSFYLTSGELQYACRAKAEALRTMVATRQERITKLRAEHGLTDQDLVSILAQALEDERNHLTRHAYSTMSVGNAALDDGQPTERWVPAGVVAAFMSERSLIENETASAERLMQIAKCVRPNSVVNNGQVVVVDSFQVSLEDLEYLGWTAR